MSKHGEAYIDSAEKKVFDVVGATALGLASMPILGGAALALCVQRRSLDPFLVQKRVSMNGGYFGLHKLRTLPQELGDETIMAYGSLDPRASKFGKLIRLLGLDELPQTLDILAGDMHLVGIRPQIDSVLEDRREVDTKLFDDWFYCYERNLGIFGYGQSYAHTVGRYSEGDAMILEVMKLDIDGYENASLRNDVSCIFGSTLGLIATTARNVSNV